MTRLGDLSNARCCDEGRPAAVNGQRRDPSGGVQRATGALREDAHYMPLGDVAKILNAAWGESWDRQFSRFAFTPVAAASIGQVHDALLQDGRQWRSRSNTRASAKASTAMSTMSPVCSTSFVCCLMA